MKEADTEEDSIDDTGDEDHQTGVAIFDLIETSKLFREHSMDLTFPSQRHFVLLHADNHRFMYTVWREII